MKHTTVRFAPKKFSIGNATRNKSVNDAKTKRQMLTDGVWSFPMKVYRADSKPFIVITAQNINSKFAILTAENVLLMNIALAELWLRL